MPVSVIQPVLQAQTNRTEKPVMSIDVKVGQVWKEYDPRTERYVKVVELGHIQGKATLDGCRSDGKLVSDKVTRSKLERFNGKRCGYALNE